MKFTVKKSDMDLVIKPPDLLIKPEDHKNIN